MKFDPKTGEFIDEDGDAGAQKKGAAPPKQNKQGDASGCGCLCIILAVIVGLIAEEKNNSDGEAIAGGLIVIGVICYIISAFQGNKK